jgi:hypothetical protein
MKHYSIPKFQHQNAKKYAQITLKVWNGPSNIIQAAVSIGDGPTIITTHLC